MFIESFSSDKIEYIYIFTINDKIVNVYVNVVVVHQNQMPVLYDDDDAVHILNEEHYYVVVPMLVYNTYGLFDKNVDDIAID